MAELQAKAREMMSAFDAMDWEKMDSLVTVDVQGVDELSRKWMRGVPTSMRTRSSSARY